MPTWSLSGGALCKKLWGAYGRIRTGLFAKRHVLCSASVARINLKHEELNFRSTNGRYGDERNASRRPSAFRTTPKLPVGGAIRAVVEGNRT